MKAKKNLFEAPVTEVQNIVNDAVSDAHELVQEDNDQKGEDAIFAAVLTVAYLSEYKLPWAAMYNYMAGFTDLEEFQEMVVNYCTNEYHKSLAA